MRQYARPCGTLSVADDGVAFRPRNHGSVGIAGRQTLLGNRDIEAVVILFERLLDHKLCSERVSESKAVPFDQRNDLHPYTVQVFDLTLTSSETKQPADFFLHEYNEAVTSLDHLLHGECRSLRSPQSGKSYGLLAVAIDLSNLGYSEGEPVDGLFLQDTLNDDQHFDPVLIAGLP
ncbi:MAG: hypothetical protein KGQ60_15610 [Planctomycetes bacterium]|nr:hypothetical protein [Planctomycetota bacterium]